MSTSLPQFAEWSDSETQTLHVILIEMNRLSNSLKLELETDLSPNATRKALKVISNMTEVLLLLQVKARKALKKFSEECAELECKILSRVQVRKKIRRSAVSLFTNSVTRKSNGKFSYYFQSVNSRHSNTYDDYEAICLCRHSFLSCLPNSKSWCVADAKKLSDGVLHSLRVEKLDKLSFSLRNSEETTLKKLQQIKQKLKFLKCIPSQTKGLSSYIDLLSKEPSNREYNWNFISQKFLNNRLTAEDCRNIWHLVAKPSICKDPWLPDEDLLLRQIANENGLQNWDHVNEQLPKRRSAFLCFVRYQTKWKKKKRAAPKLWLDEENERFEEILKRKSFTFSNCISKLISLCRCCSKKQVRSHFQYRKAMRLKKLGLFNSRERFLIGLYASKGYSISAITQLIGNRTTKQITSYLSAVRAKAVHGRWSAKEIRLLTKSVKYLGENNWTRISKFVEGRSSTQCRQKFVMLKKKGLIGNFFKKTSSNSDVKLNKIKRFLKSEKRTKKINSRSNRRFVDTEIESYFISVAKRKASPINVNDNAPFVNCVLSLLNFFGFDVPTESKFQKEIYEWLISYFSLNDSPFLFDTNFQQRFSSIKSDDLKYCTRFSYFSHVVFKYVNILPPNRCTIHGFNTFMKNYEFWAKSNQSVNFCEVWKKLNISHGKNKEFLEEKILWYRILKAFFYWPIKLKSILPDELLKK